MSDGQSRIEGARRLQRDWFQEQEFHTAVHSALDRVGFTEDYVKRLIDRPDLRQKKRKALKDTVWGMMEFDDAAMRLIDSPLIQRLRRIKQTGFTFLTYPSAEHTRFPHSIGMAHIVSRFITAINREQTIEHDHEMQAGLEGYKTIKDLHPLLPSDLIHAAILHDTGHLPFSHAAETAIEASKERFRFGGLTYEHFKDKADGRLLTQLSLSEVLSIMIVLSPRFSNFYNKYVLDTPDSDAVLRIACLIAGVRVHDKCGNIQSIISSSSVDADKIDYVSRDAVACGIPVGVDVSRVFLGSALLGLDEKRAIALSYSPSDRFVFALNASGWDTFDEIIRARSTLYQRVYLHAVTRTAEAVFARALKLNSELVVAKKPGDQALHDVISIWSETDDSVVNRLTSIEDGEIRRLAVALRDRNLPRKACAIGAKISTMQVPMASLFPKLFGTPENAGNQTEIEKLVSNQFQRRYTRRHADAVDSVSFENEIAAEATSLAAKIAKTSAESLAPRSALSTVAFIAIAALDRPNAEAPVFQHGELLTADAFTNVRGTTDAVDHFRQVGYVMADSEWREFVLIATRNVLHLRSENYPKKPFDTVERKDGQGSVASRSVNVRPLTLLGIDAVVRRVGVNRIKLDRIYAALEDASEFDQRPILARRTNSGRVIEAEKHYIAFDGEGGWSVNRDTIAAFVDQFPPALRTDLIECLNKGTYLSREQIAGSIENQIEKLRKEKTEKIVLAPLSPSSGGWVLHSLKKFARDRNIILANTIGEGLKAAKNGLLLLIDDNAASGVQAAAQLYSYAGKDRKDWPSDIADETGVFADRLNSVQLGQLKKQKIGLVVAIGHQRAVERIGNAASALELTGFQGVTFDDEIGAAVKWPEKLKKFLAEVGRDLIAQETFDNEYAKIGQENRSYCDEHSFGYGNFGGLTILPTTVPASTVTAMWMPGTWHGRPWVPLFLRWGFFDSVVFC